MKVTSFTFLAIAMTLAGCTTHQTVTAGHDEPKPSATRPSTASSTSPSASPSGSATGVGAQLLARVLPLPAGAQTWTRTPTGVFDLTGFVDNFYRPDARAYEKARATQRGFVTAARRGWFGDDGSQTEVFMVQFRSTRGARSMYADLTASWKQNSLATFTDSAVQGEGSVAEKPDSLGNVRVEVAAVRGDVFVRISRFTDATADKAAAEAVLQRQIDSLGGSSSATG